MHGSARMRIESAMAGALHVLIVVDDAVDRRRIRESLARGGIEADFTEVFDAAGLLQALHQQSFDCAIIDFHLPDATGLDVVLELQSWPERPPILMLTSVGDETVAVEVMKAGAVDYIPKSLLTPERLARSVNYGVSLWRAERAAHAAEAARQDYLTKLSALARATPSLQATLSAQKLAEVAGQSARNILNAEAVFVGVTRSDGEPLAVHVRALSAAPLLQDPPWQELWERLSKERRPLRISSETHPELLPPEPGRARCLIAAPIQDGEGQTLGVIGAADSRTDTLVESDLVILSQLARAMGAALETSRLYRAAREASLARDEVLAIVSHDLRSPLGTVLLASTALRELVATDIAHGLADRIERNIRHMQRLIDDLLDAARLDAQQLAVTVSPTAPSELIETTLTLVGPLATAAHVRLEPHVASGLPSVHADRERIAQVLSNLVNNAIKYTAPGGSIELSVRRGDGGVLFMVRDHGPGIPPEHLPHLFDRYWRPKDSRGRGVGLGLYIAQGIVVAHSGKLWVESELGQGTSFCFCLLEATSDHIERQTRSRPAEVEDPVGY